MNVGSDELRFSSTDEALQHLADVSEVTIRVAVNTETGVLNDAERRLKAIVQQTIDRLNVVSELSEEEVNDLVIKRLRSFVRELQHVL